jgi:hypothetical protein
MSDLPMIAPGYEAPEAESELDALAGCLMNTCVIDREVLTETLRAAMNRPFFRVLRVLEPLLMVLSLGLTILALTGKQTRLAVWCGFLFVMTGFFYVQHFILNPKKAVKNQLLRQAMDDGAEALVNRLWFTEESVANLRGESDLVLHMSYDKIKRLTETPRLLVITTRSNRLIPLDRRGFENGAEEDLCRLMERKAPKARIERRKTP